MSSNRKAFFTLISVLCVIVVCAAAFLVSSQQSQAGKVIFTGMENHQISYSDGKKMIEGFLNTRVDKELIAGYFGRNIFEKLMDQQKCVGIRIYKARLEDGSSTFVLIGVDRDGKDMVSGVVGENIVPCPPWCDCPPVCSPGIVATVATGPEGQTLKQ